MNFVLFSFCYSCKISGRAINNIVQSVALVIKSCLSNSETFSHYFCEYLCPGIGFSVQVLCLLPAMDTPYLLLAQGTSLIFLSKLSIICARQCIIRHFFIIKKLALDFHYKYLSRKLYTPFPSSTGVALKSFGLESL